MLRSRGNRLPSERAELAASLSSPSRSIVGGRRACRQSRSIVAAAPRLSPLPLSYSAAAPASRSIARAVGTERTPDSSSLSSSSLASARKRIGLERGSLLLSLSSSDISSPDRLYRPVDFSSVFRDRASRWSSSSAIARYRCTRTHTRRGALFPRRTAPFFERLAAIPSPISFRSPVIN